MALPRFGVGQGAPSLATVLGKTTAWFVAGSLVMASACSSDSSVDFDPTSPSGGGDTSSGGTKPSSSGSGSGATQSGGSSNANAGETQGGSAGSNATAGKNSGGKSQGGNVGTSGSAGTTSDGGKAGSSNGGSNAGSGNGGKAGNGGTANNGGSAGASGNAGTAGVGGTAGNGGNAGAGGSGGNGDCVAAAFGGHAYYFCGVVESAPAAYAKCQSLNMKMVEIESLAEQTFVVGKMKGQSWLGGTDELKEGEWRWASSGQVFWDGGPRVSVGPDGRVDGVYSNFIVGQPNNNNVDGFPENCLAINANGWNDLYCDLPDVRAACEGTGPVIQPNQ